MPKIHSEIIKVIPNNTEIKKQELKCGSCGSNGQIKSNKEQHNKVKITKPCKAQQQQ